MGRYTTGGVGRDVIAGAIAGGAAVWLISKMDWSLSHAGSPSGVAADAHPAHAAAVKAADAAGVAMNDKQKQVVGRTVHYGVGVGLGALYGLLRGMAPSVTTGRGSLYGIAAFILGDELGAPAMGLAKGPLDYPARDHAKSALAHIGFGVVTDLGTRLLSPWKDDVVIYHGPSLQERVEGGRQAIADGRDYLYDQGRSVFDQGRSYASDYAGQVRDQVDELDLPGLVETGRKRARRFADDLRSRLPDADDVAGAYDEGRRRASRYASQLPDQDDVADGVESVRKRAHGWAKFASSRLPDRDDVDDVIEKGRKQGRSFAKEAKRRLPDQDDIDDARERVRQLADDARSAGQSGFARLTRWLFG